MKVTFIIPALAVCSLAIVVNVQAEFYKYKDATGGLVITNKLADVPRKYRKNVKVVWDEELAAKDPLARRRAAAEAQREEQQRKQARQQETQGLPQGQQGGARKLQPSDGKRLVITFDEETGQLIRTME